MDYGIKLAQGNKRHAIKITYHIEWTETWGFVCSFMN